MFFAVLRVLRVLRGKAVLRDVFEEDDDVFLAKYDAEYGLIPEQDNEADGKPQNDIGNKIWVIHFLSKLPLFLS